MLQNKLDEIITLALEANSYHVKKLITDKGRILTTSTAIIDFIKNSDFEGKLDCVETELLISSLSKGDLLHLPTSGVTLRI